MDSRGDQFQPHRPHERKPLINLGRREELLTPDRPKRELKLGQHVLTLDGNNKLMRGYVSELAARDGLVIMHTRPDGSGPKMTASLETTARLNPSRDMVTTTLQRLQTLLENGRFSGPDVELDEVAEAVRGMQRGLLNEQAYDVLNRTIQYVLRKTLDAAKIDFARMPSHQGFDFEIAAVRAVQESRSNLKPDEHRIALQTVQDALGQLLVASDWYWNTKQAQVESQAA